MPERIALSPLETTAVWRNESKANLHGSDACDRADKDRVAVDRRRGEARRLADVYRGALLASIYIQPDERAPRFHRIERVAADHRRARNACRMPASRHPVRLHLH